MKANEFKQLIKEAVREAIREELSEVKTPAPAQPTISAPIQFAGSNPLMEALNMTSRSMNSQDYRNITTGTSNMAQGYDRSMFMPKQAIKPVSDDPRAVAQAVASAPKTGVDLSQLSFVHKAAAIVNTADKKKKEQYGV